MITLFGIGFVQPWLFMGLLSVPVLWWLARIMPPPPAIVAFPAIRLVMGLHSQDPDSKQSPLWLILLRALIVVLVILALTRPVLNPASDIPSDAPVLIVVENSWSAAGEWEDRRLTLDSLVAAAGRAGASVKIVETTAAPDGGPLTITGPQPAHVVAEVLPDIVPRAWDSNPEAVLEWLAAQTMPTSQVFWLPDAVTQPGEAELLQSLGRLGSFTAFESPIGAFLLSYPAVTGQGLSVPMVRTKAELPQTVTVVLNGAAGAVLGQKPVSFAVGETEKVVDFDIPATLRNDIQRISLAGQSALGATIVLDQSWQRKSVGLLTRNVDVEESPLLYGQYYVSRALSPFANVSISTLDPLMDANMSMIVEASGSRFDEVEVERLQDWVFDGGVLVRFASQRLAVSEPEPLLPVTLRTGGRLLGSTLAWDKPVGLAEFDSTGVFAGLTIPEDVRVSRQLLSEATLDAADHTWAQLADGTPLVSGRQVGSGWVVLFHVSANAEWSNLPLSGVFPQMLQRLVDLSTVQGGQDNDQILIPVQAFDAFGGLMAPPAVAAPVAGADVSGLVLSPETAPGLYRQGDQRKALNLGDFQPLVSYTHQGYPSGDVRQYRQTVEWELMGPLLAAALVLFVIETVLVLLMRRASLRDLRFLHRDRGAKTGVAGLLLVALLTMLVAPPAEALSRQEKILAAVQDTHLAYVMTGDAAVDQLSLQGLRGLSHILARRTSVEPLEPIGLDINEDELQVWPMMYWPITADLPSLPNETISRLNVYLRTGGTILFDTRDELLRQATGSQMIETENGRRLGQLLNRLDVPPLTPVPSDHVLSRTFYLMQSFPGRYTGGYVWIEMRDEANYDGVSGLVIGSHDWAAAWAVDEQLQYPVALVPGGGVQREHAYRFGVNLVMYVLTGNYKNDQVHIPAILERLGH